MKTLVLFLCSTLFVSLLHPLRAQQNHPALKITHLTGDFYVYTTWQPVDGSPYPSNSMYVVTSKGIVLIDVPWDSTQFQPLLDSLQARHHKKPVLCIATHFHSDRTAGLAFFAQKGIKTYSSAFTKKLCAEKNEKQAAYSFLKDTTFTVGNHTFQTFYPGEGHSKDNIVIWFNKEKVLYGGCFVKSIESKGLGNVADANVNQWPESIRNVMQHFEKPAYVIPGHLDWNNNKSLEHTLKLLEKDKKEALGG